MALPLTHICYIVNTESCAHVYINIIYTYQYGAATISRLFQNYTSLLQNIVSFIGLFAKENNSSKEPTDRSHPISFSSLSSCTWKRYRALSLSLCMYIHTCIHIRSYVCIYTCIYVYHNFHLFRLVRGKGIALSLSLSLYIYICMHTYMNLCMYVYMHICI